MIIVQLIQQAGSVSLALISVFAFLLAIIGALVFHEISHGYVALWNGDPTAQFYGRLTLNPLKHFNILGFAMLLLVGFGFANPVPVNPANYTNRKRGEITVALAGITTNLILAFISVLGYGLLLLIPITAQTAEFWIYFWYFWLYFFEIFTLINLNFALFNIIPLYPLDGYRLLEAFVPANNRFMTVLRQYSQFILIALVIWGSISLISDYSPLTWYILNARNGITWLFEHFWSLFGITY